jgi:Family of unknown function (DUF5675)
MYAELKRDFYTDRQVTGTLQLWNTETERKTGAKPIFSCVTLELPWKENMRRVSCIPPSKYECAYRESAKYPQHYEVKNVPNRTYILIHQGNFHSDILGCILLGDKFQDLNADGYKDVVNSKATIKKFIEITDKKPFNLVIS